MYSGAIVTFFFTPLALASVWGLVWTVPLVAVLVWRLIDEEKFLSRNLAGYTEYCRTTPYRLIPLVW
jgi:protein-S-isoprenylcysteine O-methyltransferase Ste14